MIESHFFFLAGPDCTGTRGDRAAGGGCRAVGCDCSECDRMGELRGDMALFCGQLFCEFRGGLSLICLCYRDECVTIERRHGANLFFSVNVCMRTLLIFNQAVARILCECV